MYEREVWEVPDYALTDQASDLRTINIWKSTNYLTTQVSLNQYLSFNAITYFQTGYDPEREFFRHRISLDGNILVKISSPTYVSYHRWDFLRKSPGNTHY